MDPILQLLRQRAPGNELDYGFVMDCLSDYGNPRTKLSRLLDAGDLIRVKKGIYVFGEHLRKGDLCMEMLANWIYGPSYVSLEWAMQYYGLIPERVDEITSVTTKRGKIFRTAIGRFSYTHTKANLYPLGLTRIEDTPYQNALIATKEKALADLLVLRRGKVTSLKELEMILFEDFRLEEEDLHALDYTFYQRMQSIRPQSAIEFLIKWLAK